MYFIESPTELHRHVFRWLLFLLGAEGKEAAEASDPGIVIYYGDEPPKGTAYPLVILRGNDSVTGEPPRETDVEITDRGAVLSYDLIESLAALLSDHINAGRPDSSLDEHQRLRFDASFRPDLQLTAAPLANACVRHLAALLERFANITPTPLWPEGKKCVIALSHDVDDPDKYAPLRAPLYAAAHGPAWNARHALSRLKLWTRSLRDPEPDNFWLFDRVMDAEAAYGFRSTFFFASRSRYDAGSSILDVPYDLSDPRFQSVFDRMRRDGFGIGLHASYRAFEAVERFTEEKDRLEALAGADVAGLRHHYWHLGPQPERTLEYHETAGFEYDSSLGFNDRMGFRRHIALPWFPWSEQAGRGLDVMQLPTFCMDGNLFYRPIEIDAALNQIADAVAIIKACGGIGSVDWHVRTSFPGNPEFRNWGEAYVRLLEMLAFDREIWVTSLEEVNQWMRGNRARGGVP